MSLAVLVYEGITQEVATVMCPVSKHRLRSSVTKLHTDNLSVAYHQKVSGIFGFGRLG